jgi:hypothetical protein
MTNLAELQWALVRYRTGDVSADWLSSLAMKFVADGMETRALWGLVEGSSSPEETLHLLRQAVVDAGLPDDMESAVREYVEAITAQIVRRDLAAYEGARKIWDAALLVPGTHDYDPFIYAASEYDDRPGDRRFFEDEIMKEAKRWTDDADSL